MLTDHRRRRVNDYGSNDCCCSPPLHTATEQDNDVGVILTTIGSPKIETRDKTNVDGFPTIETRSI